MFSLVYSFLWFELLEFLSHLISFDLIGCSILNIILTVSPQIPHTIKLIPAETDVINYLVLREHAGNTNICSLLQITNKKVIRIYTLCQTLTFLEVTIELAAYFR